MNFAQMLMTPVTPLSERVPERNKPVCLDKRFIVMSNLNDARSAQAWVKYKTVIGDGWTNTREIEKQLGTGRSVAYKTLEKYYSRGWLDRRPAGGESEFNRRKGWEWKCVK